MSEDFYQGMDIVSFTFEAGVKIKTPNFLGSIQMPEQVSIELRLAAINIEVHELVNNLARKKSNDIDVKYNLFF